MSYEEILGLERPREILAKVLLSGRVPHAFLFHGAEGLGKRTVALRLAASLLCQRPAADSRDPCGSCEACRKVAAGSNPDVLVVTRLPKEGSDDDASEGELKSVISVAQVRELALHAAYAPREGDRRVFIVDPADRLTTEAGNALLKTLEEPPGRAVIVLVTSRPHALLATIRSRCFQVGFGAMRPSVLAEALRRRGLPAAEAERRAALSEGRPGRAIALDVEALGARRDAVLDMIAGLVASERAVAELGSYAAALAGESEEDLIASLEMVASIARDASRLASGREEILHADARAGIEPVARTLGAARAAAVVALADSLRGDLRVNANRTLVAETLLAAVAGAVPAA